MMFVQMLLVNSSAPTTLVESYVRATLVIGMTVRDTGTEKNPIA